jgi:hypothetical protein
MSSKKSEYTLNQNITDYNFFLQCMEAIALAILLAVPVLAIYLANTSTTGLMTSAAAGSLGAVLAIVGIVTLAALLICCVEYVINSPPTPSKPYKGGLFAPAAETTKEIEYTATEMESFFSGRNNPHISG